MTKNYWWILIICIVLFALYPFVFRTTKTTQVIINSKIFNIEVADNDAERAKGLSGRDYLASDTGMLFVFPKADIWPFWMEGTKIPLDIIYIDNNKIVEVTTLAPPTDGNIPSYTPTQKAQYVLELNANSGFKVGDSVQIKY